MEIDFWKLNEVYYKILQNSWRDVIPVVIQDESTKDVLACCYIDNDSLIYSLKEGIVALWSTSRNELWVKGATSNQCFKLKKVLLNCEGNSLLFLVEPQNNAGFCHMKNDSGEHRKSCFFREVILDENGETKVV